MCKFRNSCLEETKKNKTLGPDRIVKETITALNELGIDRLKKIYNSRVILTTSANRYSFLYLGKQEQ